MKTMHLAGAAALSTCLAGAASAATFSYTFYLEDGLIFEEPDFERQECPIDQRCVYEAVPQVPVVVGTGTFSFDGPANEGLTTRLTGVSYSWTVNGQVFDDQNGFNVLGGPAGFLVEEFGDDLFARFGMAPDIPTMNLAEVDPEISEACTLGLLTFFNQNDYCLNMDGRFIFEESRLSSLNDGPLEGSWSLFSNSTIFAENALLQRPISGSYRAILIDDVAPVPVPAALPLLALGLGGLGVMRRRQKS